MVAILPESWRLPSILHFVTQLGWIGSVIFILLNRNSPVKFTHKRAIHFVLVSSMLLSLATAFFWNQVTILFDAPTSLTLIMFNFLLSFMGKYFQQKKCFLIFIVFYFQIHSYYRIIIPFCQSWFIIFGIKYYNWYKIYLQRS